jgi:hypothetical protein
MAAKARKLKMITLTIGGSSFEAQITTWKLTNSTSDATVTYTFSPDGAVTDTPDPSWSLDIDYLSDWSVGGINDYLTVHDGETAAFQLDHLYDIVGEHVRWTGNVTLKAPDAGGAARSNEVASSKLIVVGEPVYTHL